MTMKTIAASLLLALAAAPATAQAPEPAPAATAAGPWEPAERMAAQREAMAALAFLDGTWRGTAEADELEGELVQTERVGTLLGGTIRLVEGRGYDASGETAFNALGIVSYDPVQRRYKMRSYAMGYWGDYPLEVRADGFSWSHPGGPGATIRYTATVKDGEWHEVGERVAEGAPPVRVLEMRLRRLGDADWPHADAVPPR